MNYKLDIIAVLLIIILPFVDAGLKRRREVGKCAYLADPHLIPFPTAPGQIVNQYMCRPDAEEILVQNSFLQMNVTSDPNGNYIITSYTLIIKPVPGYPKKCVISDNTANPATSLSCPSASPAIATLNGQSLHIQHRTRNITIDIDNFGYYIDTYVNLPYNIIAKSTGVCVKWDCELEIDYVNGRKKRDVSESIDAVAICDAFASAAAKQAGAEADPDVVQAGRDICISDITLTGNTQFTQTIGVSVFRSSIEDYENDKGYLKRLAKANADGKKLFCKTATAGNGIVAKSKNRCSVNPKRKQCLQKIDTSKLCNTSG